MPVALVVDDNYFYLRMATLLLERHGFEVVTAEDGEEGYAVFHVHMARIDIVIADLMMPKLSGAELLESIKKERPDVPVVLVTGAESAGNNSYPDFDLVLHKPLEPDFVEMVKGLIHHSKA